MWLDISQLLGNRYPVFELKTGEGSHRNMKIAYTSDIHVDMSEANHGLIDALIDRLVSVKPDVFIIAGDISQSLEKIAETLDRFSKAPGRKMLVPGNHDIWIDSKSRLRQGIDSTVKYENLIPAVCSEFGFEFLPAGPITIGDIGFAGTMGWYDYSFRNRCRTSMCVVPTTGSPPMPTQVDWPKPASVVCFTAS